MGNKTNARRLSLIAMFAAVIIIQNYVPLLGYIPVGPLEVTTIHITVIIAAVIMGPVDGAIVGGIWGLIDWIRAITVTSSVLGNVVMVNPLVSILPRILIGLFAGLIMNYLYRKNVNKQLSMIISALAGSVTNTVLVLSMIYVFYHNGSAIYTAINLKALTPYLLTIAGVNGIPEAIAAMIIVPLIATPLLRFTSIGKNRFR